MGCGGSKEASHELRQLPARMVVSAPSGGPQLVPPAYRNAAGRPITHQDFELDRSTLIQALDHMGRYLDSQGVTVNVVTVGGAVNTIYLRSRRTTHDVDFFLEDPTSSQHQVIHEAARSAARYATANLQAQLGANWFNNATQMLMSRAVQQRLAKNAFRQNTILHQYRGQRGGIVVYVAPWSYGFCGKLNRLCETNHRSYDADDAVTYLHEYLRTAGRQTVSAGEVAKWCHEYGKNVTDAVLSQVNNKYYELHGRRVIVRP